MIEQRTQEWFAQRAGKVTASRVVDVLAKVKAGEAASRANYRAQLVAERLTGVPAETYSNGAMQWGTDTEPLARASYELRNGLWVKDAGFVSHPTIENAGASPDGYVGDSGLIEIKCPNTATHIETLLAKKAPGKYIPQMQFQMACTGSDWCDFVSFDPRMPEKHQLFVFRVARDEEFIKAMEAEVVKFLEEVQTTINELEQI